MANHVQKIIEKGVMPDGTEIQIEDWSAVYPGTKYAWMIGAYPIAKHSSDRPFGPRKGKIFRCGLEFRTEAEARGAYDRLMNGARLTDFRNRFWNPSDIEYLED